MKIRILIADDHKIMCEGLRSILENVDDFHVVATASDGREALKKLNEHQIDVAIMDINMPNLNGIEACHQIKTQYPQTKVLALSIHTDNELVSRMIESGATGYIPKNCSGKELIEAIRTVTKDQTYLSPSVATSVFHYLQKSKASKGNILTHREREVLQLISEGKTTKEIATLLSVSETTVETHRRNIMDKVGIRNIAELTKFAIREGLTSLD